MRQERPDRPERNDRNVRHEKNEKIDKYESHPKADRSDYQRRERTPQLDKHSERNTGENFTKMKSYEQNKQRSTEVFEGPAIIEDIVVKKSKHFEPKVSHNLDNNHEIKFREEEEYDDYYNLDFSRNLPKEVPKSHRNQRHNRSGGANSGTISNRNDNNYNNNEIKSRNKPENSNQRKFVAKSHNRYVHTYEPSTSAPFSET